jgi:hypothetical protein
LQLEPEARALMLRHESEHIRARDPLMLFAGVLLVALFPWNPALWMLVRRLRLAVEIDCDQRVLRSSSQQREYGILLLAVGARHASPMPFATSLAERRPFLERRIRALTESRPRNPRLVSIACVAVALTVLTAAVRAPHPQSLAQAATAASTQTPTLVPARAVAGAPTPSLMPAPSRASTIAPASPSHELVPARATSAVPPTSTLVPNRDWHLQIRKGGSLTAEEIRALIAVHYPSVLAGDPSINLITFVIDAKGDYVASSSAFQPTFSQEEKARAEANAARDAEISDMRGRGRGGIVMRDNATPEDSARRSAELMVVRTNLLRRMTGDSVIVATTSGGGRSSDLAVIRSDSGVAINRINSVDGGLNVDPKDIDNVEVIKGAGKFGPLNVSVIVIQLK